MLATSTRRTRRLLGLVLLASLLAALVAALVAAASRAQSSGTDSTYTESPPAPLIVPGQTPLDTTAQTSLQRGQAEYLKGRALERQGFPGAAIMAYTNAVRADPDLRDANFRMGKLFLTRQQWVPAALSFAEELRRDPGNREAGRELGWSMANAGDSARSIAQLELLVRRDARDAPAWQTLGFAYARFGRPADAERALRRAVALDPRDADAWRDLGVVLAAGGREAEARAAYQKALALAPSDETTLIDLANLEARSRRWNEALAAYRRAERVDSTQGLAYMGQVQALRALDRAADAGPVYRRWLAVHPDDANARIEAIVLFEQLGRHDVALELGRDAVRNAPDSGEARLALGLAHRAGGEIREAMLEFRQAERTLNQPEQRERVRALLGAIRATASDSLRALFEEDSLAQSAAVGGPR